MKDGNARKLRAWRKDRGLTVEAAALEFGCSHSRVSRLEGGDRPSLPLATRIEQKTLGYVRAADWIASADGEAAA